MSLDQDIERGQQADRLLKDPLLKEAFDTVAVALHQRWEDAPIRDLEGAHELKLMLKLLNDVRSNIAQVLETGTLAAIEIKGRETVSPAQWNSAWRKSYYAF